MTHHESLTGVQILAILYIIPMILNKVPNPNLEILDCKKEVQK